MSVSSEQRRLAAIMFTDMVGYSALAQHDEALALRLLEEHRDVLRSIFPRFNGTEIKTIGDAFLVEFQSALEAAQCAIEIQRTLAKRNHDVTSEQRIELRIGIHIGDVVHREGDVYGDGVNIASRIQPVAGIGGICISMDVERQIHHALEVTFEKLAPTELKNIQVSMDLFRIVLPWERQIPVAAKRQAVVASSRKPSARALVIGAIALILLLIIGIGWWWTTLPHVSGAAAPSGSIDVPAKSIAVLPFENLSSDKENAYFAEGIQDEILTRLSKIAALKVISRTSTQKYKSAPENLREIGKQLGVANLLEGSVQKIANAVHVNVQLIRAATDEHVWAESYNRKLDDVFGVEGEVASAIAEQLNARLSGAEEKALNEKPTQNTAAYDAYLRGLSIEQSRTDDAAQQEAIANYSTAVRLDPKFALAWARLAVLRSLLYFDGYDLVANSPVAVKQAADTALALQPQFAEAFVAQGVYRYRVLRDFRGALESYGEALKRLPNSSLVLEQMGHVERRLGEWDAAEKHYRSAVELDPRNVDCLSQLADLLAGLRHFAEAQATWDRVLQLSPDDDATHANKAISFDGEGRVDEAAREVAKLKANSPNVYANVVKALHLQMERRFEEAIAFIQTNPLREFRDDPRTITELALCQEWAGHKEEARAAFARAVTAIKPTPDTVVPIDSRTLSAFLAWDYSGLGQTEKALEQAKSAMIDYKEDALAEARAEQVLAIVQVRCGDVDSALTTISHLLDVPYGITPAQLRLDPLWDPLRKEPRFAKLIAEPQPK